jgi:hypothetical protein
MAYVAERTGDRSVLDDRTDCRELIAAYGPAVDWIDGPTLREIFWPAATVDLGPGFFRGPVEVYVATVIDEIETTFLRRMHNPGSVHVRMRGDSAEAENAAVNQTLAEVDGVLTLSTYTGRYLWKLERRNGRWGVTAMQFLLVSAQHARYDRSGEYPGLNVAEDLALRASFFA